MIGDCGPASAPLTRGGATKDGIRVPVPDLKRFVVDAIAERLRDASWVMETFCRGLGARESHRVVQAAAALASDMAADPDGAETGAVETARGLIRRAVG